MGGQRRQFPERAVGRKHTARGQDVNVGMKRDEIAEGLHEENESGLAGCRAISRRKQPDYKTEKTTFAVTQHPGQGKDVLTMGTGLNTWCSTHSP